MPLLLFITMNTANLLKIFKKHIYASILWKKGSNPLSPLFISMIEYKSYYHIYNKLLYKHLYSKLILLPSFLPNIKIFDLVTYFFRLSLFFLFDIDCNKASLFLYFCVFLNTSWLSWPIYNFADINWVFVFNSLFQHKLA